MSYLKMIFSRRLRFHQLKQTFFNPTSTPISNMFGQYFISSALYIPSNISKQIRGMIPQLLSLSLILSISLNLSAKENSAFALKLASPFQDHMVLQRDQPVPIWGWSTPKTKVTVTFASQTKHCMTNNQGEWNLKLEPMNANVTPATMTIRHHGEVITTIEDVLVGEVWFCSGQSNMDWKIRQLGGRYDKDVAMANHPNLRVCSIPKDMFATTPQAMVDMSWQRCTPQVANTFSAVAYFFGSKLLKELNVPIGLITSPRGGSKIEGWISEPALRKDFPEFTKQLDTFSSITTQTGGVFDHRKKSKIHGVTQRTPAALYNVRVNPFIPYAIRGAIWYQGESNVSKPEQYQKLFPAMIQQWREAWEQGDFPFYYVQIAPFAYKNPSAAFLREAQLMTMTEPNTGMVVTMDLGDPKNIHPLQKKPVGERLALWALAKDYPTTQLSTGGVASQLIYSGPQYTKSTIEGETMRLHFKHIGRGLASRDEKPLTHFSIAGADNIFVEANAVIQGDTIVVSSDIVSLPVAVRFAFESADMPNLMNRDGLPASSFRTDHYSIGKLEIAPSISEEKPQTQERHLFILSGQSNMVGMDPKHSFTPVIHEKFGPENVIIVKDAHGGQSIRSWCKENHEFPPPTVGRIPKVRGDLYRQLIQKVQASIDGVSLKTITFIWMQGESDLRNTAYRIYLDELVKQLKTDLNTKVLHLVIGRISDCGLDQEKRLKEKLLIRKTQVEFATSQPRGEWVNTDDLNDVEKDGKIFHDLHYTKEGYVTLGKRFAEKAILLIKKFEKP